jgi:D-sedoheptulose 7-phosphate isomerase
LASAYKPPARIPSGDPAFSSAAYFDCLSQAIPRLPYETIDAISAALVCAVQEQRTIFVFGNGGSAASASHMMCDLNKGATSAAARRARVMALTDNVPLLTAWANDCGYDKVFSEQIKNFAQPGDVAVAISGSGNSANVLLGLRTARDAGAFTIGLAGFNGGNMKALCDLCAVVPSDNMQIVEDLHHAVLHSIFSAVRVSLIVPERKVLTVKAGGLRS